MEHEYDFGWIHFRGDVWRLTWDAYHHIFYARGARSRKMLDIRSCDTKEEASVLAERIKADPHPERYLTPCEDPEW